MRLNAGTDKKSMDVDLPFIRVSASQRYSWLVLANKNSVEQTKFDSTASR